MKTMNSSFNPSPSLLPDHQDLTLTPPPRPPNPRTPSFSSSASSLSSSPSSFSFSTSSSPFSCSSIPFSWERHPGIPKSPSVTPSAISGDLNPLLPLPPPLRSARTVPPRKRSTADPFAAALVECAKDPPTLDPIWWRRSYESRGGGAVGKMVEICRRTVMADRAGFLDLFSSFSCKASSCSVVSDAAIVVPRSRARAARSYGMLDRRSD